MKGRDSASAGSFLLAGTSDLQDLGAVTRHTLAVLWFYCFAQRDPHTAVGLIWVSAPLQD